MSLLKLTSYIIRVATAAQDFEQSDWIYTEEFETFAKNVKISIILGYILIAIFNVCYLVFFFKLNDLLVSFIFCFIDVICILLVGFALIKHKFRLSWLFLLIFIWYAFSLTLSYFILMKN